jgi:hypothetical protein
VARPHKERHIPGHDQEQEAEDRHRKVAVFKKRNATVFEAVWNRLMPHLNPEMSPGEAAMVNAAMYATFEEGATMARWARATVFYLLAINARLEGFVEEKEVEFLEKKKFAVKHDKFKQGPMSLLNKLVNDPEMQVTAQASDSTAQASDHHKRNEVFKVLKARVSEIEPPTLVEVDDDDDRVQYGFRVDSVVRKAMKESWREGMSYAEWAKAAEARLTAAE